MTQCLYPKIHKMWFDELVALESQTQDQGSYLHEDLMYRMKKNQTFLFSIFILFIADMIIHQNHVRHYIFNPSGFLGLTPSIYCCNLS